MGCYCDYEMPEFFTERKRKARKCYGDIQVGEIYLASAGLWGGEFNEFKQCAKCVSLIELMKSHIKCFCYAFGTLIADSYECIQGYGDDASAMVFPVYRHVVRRNKNIDLRKKNAA